MFWKEIHYDEVLSVLWLNMEVIIKGVLCIVKLVFLNLHFVY